MSSEPELLPCPFCGGHEAFVQNAGWQANTFIRCPGCDSHFGLASGYRSHAESVAAWNRRASSGAASGMLQYLQVREGLIAAGELKEQLKGELSMLRGLIAKATGGRMDE